MVRAACCREGDDTNTIPPNLRYIEEKGLHIPFKSKWIAHVLWTAIKDTRGLPYQMMCEILKLYINECALLNNILQDACEKAKVDLLGNPEENVKYTYAIAKAIEEMGHTVELIFTYQRQTMKTVNALVLKEEFDRKKAEKLTMT
jgi:hypothetical protein